MLCTRTRDRGLVAWALIWAAIAACHVAAASSEEETSQESILPGDRTDSRGDQLLAQLEARGHATDSELDELATALRSQFRTNQDLVPAECRDRIDRVRTVMLGEDGEGASPEVRARAVSFVRAAEEDLRRFGIQFGTDLLEEQRQLALDTSEAFPLLIELANYYSFSGEWSEANKAQSQALDVMLPEGQSVEAFAPSDPAALGNLAYWLHSRSTLLFEVGAIEASAMHAERLGRLVEETVVGEDYAYSYMAYESRMQTSGALGESDRVRDLWEEVERQPWFTEPLYQGYIAQLLVSRFWAEVDAERRGESVLFDPRPALEEWIRDRGPKPSDTWPGAQALAFLLLGRGDELGASEVMGQALDVEEPDRRRMALALGLRKYRLSGELASLGEQAVLAREAFDSLMRAWFEKGPRELGGGLLQVASRSCFVVELLLAELELGGEATGARSALELLLRSHSPPEERPEVGLSHVLSNLIAPGRGFVAFVPSRVGSLALWGTEAGLGGVLLEPFDRLTGVARELESSAIGYLVDRTVGARQTLDESAKAATELFLPEDLWEAISACPELVIIGAEDFAWPAFELLEPKPEAPLGLTHALSYLSTLDQAVTLGDDWRRQGKEGAPVAIVAPPSAQRARDLNLEPLEVGQRELALLEEAVGAFGLGEGEVVTGANADLSAVSRAANAAWLSLIAHGVTDPFRIRPSGLWLASGSGVERYWSEDFESIHCAPIVSLFSCRAGLSKIRRGSGGGGHLATALQSAGARAVTLSTTDLDYLESLELNAAFGRELVGGASYAEALRRARVRVAASTNAYPINALLVRLHGWGAGAAEIVPRAADRGSAVGRAWLAAGLVLTLVGLLSAAALSARKRS